MRNSFVLKETPAYNVIVHYHMMKNAGSTIAAILEREFVDAYAEVHGPGPGSMITGDELIEFIKKHPKIRAISSHHIRFPVPSGDRLHFGYCCFVRHPVDRLYSLYSFFRKSGDTSVIGTIARQLEPPDFFSCLIDEFPNYVCNVQTGFLACRGFFLRPPDQEDLKQAMNVIRQCSLPGIVHQTNESLAVGEYFLSPNFPGIQLHSPPQNVSMDPHRSEAERERMLKEVCGQAVYDRLLALNRLDVELARRAEEEVERRKALVPSWGRRLAEFEERCGVSCRGSESDGVRELRLIPRRSGTGPETQPPSPRFQGAIRDR